MQIDNLKVQAHDKREEMEEHNEKLTALQTDYQAEQKALEAKYKKLSAEVGDKISQASAELHVLRMKIKELSSK